MTKPDGMRGKEALAALASNVKLSDYEAGEYSGGRRFEKIARFATVDTVKAGWLVKNKGTWVITEAGQDAFGKFTDPAAFYEEAVRLYREWAATRPEKENFSDPTEEPEGEGPVGEREVTHFR